MKLKPYRSPFIYHDENDKDHLYRGIKEHEIKLLSKIVGLKNLVEHEILDDTIEIGGKIVRLAKMKKVPADIRIQELTKKQSKKLLCDQVDLCVSALENGVCAHDISESNILYWAGKSYFTDLNAFSNPNDSRGMTFSYVRLSYMVNRYLAGNNVVKSSVHANHKSIKLYKDWTAENWTPNQDIGLWKRFQKYIHNFKVEEAKKTHWSDEYAHDKEKLKENEKLKIVTDIMKDIKCESLLDIGTNKGYYIDTLKDKFNRLIGFDCDHRCIDLAEKQYGNNKTTFVTFGIESFFNDNTNMIDRYKSDFVLALAVTHHFATNKINVKKAAQTICDLSNEKILIEDIDNGHIYHEIFIENGFKKIDQRNSSPSNRKLSLWSK